MPSHRWTRVSRSSLIKWAVCYPYHLSLLHWCISGQIWNRSRSVPLLQKNKTKGRENYPLATSRKASKDMFILLPLKTWCCFYAASLCLHMQARKAPVPSNWGWTMEQLWYPMRHEPWIRSGQVARGPGFNPALLQVWPGPNLWDV